ncbi:flagellar filament protein FlaA [Spirochaetia bacterium]|nr:flagellar filament protein FlaA [Spirochaetia bacterium]GHU36801.1 flagellar filament protein FlaA [Spirochaetia bacterium]
MKKYSVVLFLVCAGVAFAQNDDGFGAINYDQIGQSTAQQYLKEVSLDKFEYDGYWKSVMSSDQGYTSSRLFDGKPAGSASEPIADEAALEIPDRYVLGTRVDFLRRGYSSVTLYPTHPIPVEGITKTISIWVAGRNFNHELKILIQDFFGRQFELSLGKLNFQGWKKLTVAVPPQEPDGINGIVQRNYHYTNQMGIKVVGLKINFDPDEAVGTYYVYFDDLRAVTDIFYETDRSRDTDDMIDAW